MTASFVNDRGNVIIASPQWNQQLALIIHKQTAFPKPVANIISSYTLPQGLANTKGFDNGVSFLRGRDYDGLAFRYREKLPHTVFLKMVNQKSEEFRFGKDPPRIRKGTNSRFITFNKSSAWVIDASTSITVHFYSNQFLTKVSYLGSIWIAFY